MATTGFWPVKGRLKDVIEYARNPDKTTDPKFLDEDLYRALRYVADDEKTDRLMYVSGINCTPEFAYKRMRSTKERFGKLGGNVAYHGYQSFANGEVSAEEAHQIGIETAKRMWGDDYEVVVTTHLNTDNIHNHIVINSVSFKTGKKFENHVKDHYRLREISDKICKEHNKSVLENSQFYGGEKSAYWIHKKGKLTRLDILRRDLDFAIGNSTDMQQFERKLELMGYTIMRNENYAHYSIKAEGWTRAVRIERLGPQYNIDAIYDRLDYQLFDNGFRREHMQKRKFFPTHSFEAEIKKIERMGDMQALLFVFCELLKLVLGMQPTQANYPMSPALRQEVTKLEKYDRELRLLTKYEIHTLQELSTYIQATKQEIRKLEELRSKADNLVRRASTEEDKTKYKQMRRDITAEIKPLRQKLKTAEEITADSPMIMELINIERNMEQKALTRERKYDR